MKKIILNILTIAILFTMPLYSTDTGVGTSGGQFVKVGGAGSQFLKIDIGARANGMGGAFSAIVNDLTGIYWNPGGIADVKGMSANFSYTQWFADYSHNFAAFALPLSDNFTFGLHMVNFGTDKVEITTLDNPEGTGTYYSINDFCLGATVGGYLTDQFSFGITVKYITNGFADLSSSGIAFDIGTMYQTGISGIKLGFAILNLGTEMTYTGQDLNTTKKIVEDLNASPLDAQFLTNPYSMPLIFRAGATSEIINNEDHKLIAALQFDTFSDVPEQFVIGAEYTWNNLLSLRAGYRLGHDQLNLSGGFGFNYVGEGFQGQLDYAISPTADLGLVNRLTLNIGLK